MKKFLLPFSLCFLFFCGCTKDGKDGKSYISIDWEYHDDQYKVSAYADDNPSTPEGQSIVAGQYYQSSPGTYSYSYRSEDYDYYYDHTGTYTLIFYPGTKATLFKDGKNGEDSYFDLYLSVYKKKSQPISNGIYGPETRQDTIFSGNGYLAIKEYITIISKSK